MCFHVSRFAVEFILTCAHVIANEPDLTALDCGKLVEFDSQTLQCLSENKMPEPKLLGLY